MNGTRRKFRVLKKKDTAIVYIAVPDLLEYFRELREKTAGGLAYENMIEDFSKIIYEGWEQ